MSDPAQRFYNRLTEWFANDQEFSTTEAIKKDSLSDHAVRDYLKVLADTGVVDQVQPHKGCIPATWKINGTALDDAGGDCPELPAVEDVFDGGNFQLSDNVQNEVA